MPRIGATKRSNAGAIASFLSLAGTWNWKPNKPQPKWCANVHSLTAQIGVTLWRRCLLVRQISWYYIPRRGKCKREPQSRAEQRRKEIKWNGNNYTFQSGISFLWNRTSSVSSWFDSVEIVIGSVYLFRLAFVSLITAHFCGFLAIKRNALPRLTHNAALDMYHTYSVTLFIFNWKSISFDTICALFRSPLTISIRITQSLIRSHIIWYIVYRPLVRCFFPLFICTLRTHSITNLTSGDRR